MDVFTGINTGSSYQERSPDGKLYHQQCENRKMERRKRWQFLPTFKDVLLFVLMV